MVNADLHNVLGHLRDLRDMAALSEAPDAQLLECFTHEHAEAAFAALVRRHGPMVWSVSRRVLPHVQDIEDVFQATFLLLARRAASIRKTESVGSWLHGVAHRLALKLRVQHTRRLSREKRATDMRQSRASDQASLSEVQAALDSALEKLPEKYRAALVLCYLEGMSQEEAARHLDCPLSTLRTRVARGRKLLRDRLAAQGLTLSSAGLATLLIASAAPAVAPAGHVKAAVEAALPFAAGQPAAALCSKQAAGLVEGGLRTMFLSKVDTARALLLVLGLAVTGAGVLAHQALAAREQPVVGQQSSGKGQQPAAATGTEVPKQPAGDKSDRSDLSGRVLGPDGDAVHGARVVLWPGAGKAPIARTTTDPEGRFHLRAGKQASRGATVVATAQGYASDWRVLLDDRPGEMTLRVAKDDVPIKGRVLTLEGKPVTSARVRVLGVEKNPDGDLTPWVEGVKKGYWFQWKRMPPGAIGLPAVLTTDQNGRFQLTGVGGERLVFLRVEGSDIEYDRFHVMTREGKPPAEGGHHGVYPATFDHLAGPGRTAKGLVREQKTGIPLAGISIVDVNRHNWAVTGKDGRYTLPGLPRQKSYTLTAGGASGLPYFDVTHSDIAGGEGPGPINVDFELERGLEISGRLTEKKTGRPLTGHVWYFPLPANPLRDDYERLHRRVGAPVSEWGTVQADGSFVVLGVPGPAVLIPGLGGNDRFPVINARQELMKRGINSWPGGATHGLVEINPTPNDPTSLTCDITLAAGLTRRGLVQGPNGQRLPGVEVAGLYPHYLPTQKLKKAEFTLHGLRDGAKRVLIFLDRPRKLGKVQEVRGGDTDLLTVRLQPLGTLTGRVVDVDHRPVAGHQVAAFPDLSRKGYENLPDELLPFGRSEGIGDGAWYDLTGRRAVTNAEGRFSLGGLLSGVPYTVVAAEGQIRSGQPVTHQRGGLIVDSGKETDLGDWSAGVPPKKRSGRRAE
jgi:RNA polymerase sigma factor (sigma-70 family)